MKLTVQTLKNTVATLEVDPEVDTFDVIRQRVIQEFKYPEDSQIVLIHQTKIITKTTDAISSVPSIKDGDRIVIMKKSTPPKPATTPAQPPPAQPVPVEPPQEVSSTPAETDANNLLVGSDAQSAVAELMAMGFERPAVVQAMRAAFNNPDRAAEYLMNGIPAAAQAEVAPSPAAAGGAENPPTGLTESEFGAAPSEEGQQPSGGAGGQQDLISTLRQVARTNPQMLPGLLQVLGTQNPALLALIQEHPEQFMQMLMAGGGGQEAHSPGDPQPGPEEGTISVSLTEEEIGAVTRLEEMGFPRDAAIQAYLACDKDENSAANFLFDSGNDFRGHD